MAGPPWGYGGYPYIPLTYGYGGTYIYPLYVPMGVPIYTWRGVGGVGRGVPIYTYYICVCAYAYIHAIYMYVHIFIYIVYVCMCKGLYIQYLCYTNSPYLYKGMGVCLYRGSRVGQSARRLCTLFNFQRLPQYTNSRVVYKGLYVRVLYEGMGMGLYTYYLYVWVNIYIHSIYMYAQRLIYKILCL